MTCLARLVRAILGDSGVADKKLECGPVLTVLGISLSMSAVGYTARPARDKAQKCIDAIDLALKACDRIGVWAID